MERPFTPADSGKLFRFFGTCGAFNGRVGELEGFPLVDPGSAEHGEGILWFGPRENRDGWDYVSPSDVEPLYRLRTGELVTSADGDWPKQYIHRTGAEKAASNVPGGEVIQRGRPFYVRVPEPVPVGEDL